MGTIGCSDFTHSRASSVRMSGFLLPLVAGLEAWPAGTCQVAVLRLAGTKDRKPGGSDDSDHEWASGDNSTPRTLRNLYLRIAMDIVGWNAWFTITCQSIVQRRRARL